jgi:hypothetical protein
MTTELVDLSQMDIAEISGIYVSCERARDENALADIGRFVASQYANWRAEFEKYCKVWRTVKPVKKERVQ